MYQTIFRGAGCLKNISNLFTKYACRKVLVVHGRSSFEASGAREILHSSPGVEFIQFGEVTANPETDTVIRCAALFNEFKPDTLLAIGGGSVIDTAKAVLAYLTKKSEPEILANSFDPLPGKPRFWTAPTTAGSGSESTHFAVLYKNGVKYSLAHPGLKPDIVFLDPLLTLSCSPMLTLASGVDAICQSVESFWSRGGTDASRALAMTALPQLLSSIFSATENGGNLEARAAMLSGANLAGQAIDISKTTAAHAMSYGLTSTFDFPHGLAVLLAMGPLVELMHRKYDFFTGNIELAQAFAAYGPSFPEAFNKFYEEAMLRFAERIKISAEGLSIEDIKDSLAAGVNVERLSNHPIVLSAEDIAALYRKILDRIITK